MASESLAIEEAKAKKVLENGGDFFSFLKTTKAKGPCLSIYYTLMDQKSYFLYSFILHCIQTLFYLDHYLCKILIAK